MNGAGNDNAANPPKFYFTHYFSLNFIVNQGLRRSLSPQNCLFIFKHSNTLP